MTSTLTLETTGASWSAGNLSLLPPPDSLPPFFRPIFLHCASATFTLRFRYVLSRYPDKDDADRGKPSLEPPPLTRKQFNKSAEALREETSAVLVIKTADDGYNSGQSFYLSTIDKTDNAVDEWITSLREAAAAAKHRFRLRAAWRTFQLRLAGVYQHGVFQGLVALTIVANFVFLAIQLEVHPEPGSELFDVLETCDFAVTMVFAGELAINLVAHWFRPFWRDGW